MGTTRQWVMVGGLALALAGTAAQAQVMTMPRHANVVTTAPAVRTWVPGHWEQRGRSQVWVDGHWVVSHAAHGSPDWQASRWVHPRDDLDRDGVPNRYDRDRDGDGVPNRYDRRPDDPRRR